MKQSGVRRLLSRGANYARRLDRWRSILWDVRGQGSLDQVRLAVSGAASPVVSLVGLDGWRDPKLLFDATVDVNGVGRFHLRRNTDDLWHVLPRREAAVFRAIRATLKAGDTFVDAGANIGVYSVLAGKIVGPTGRVVAIEMMPKTRALLMNHLALNGLTNVSVVEMAVSNAAGQTVAVALPERGQHGQASIAREPTSSSDVVTVETTTLDEVLADFDHVTVMKMDLEGAEELALQGARDVLKRTQHVIFEDWGAAHLSAIMESNGFDVRRLDGNNCLATRRH